MEAYKGHTDVQNITHGSGSYIRDNKQKMFSD